MFTSPDTATRILKLWALTAAALAATAGALAYMALFGPTMDPIKIGARSTQYIFEPVMGKADVIKKFIVAYINALIHCLEDFKNYLIDTPRIEQNEQKIVPSSENREERRILKDFGLKVVSDRLMELDEEDGDVTRKLLENVKVLIRILQEEDKAYC
ncbi:hypothetical protein BDB01DRAFT_792720 [Pilobolus umbonatus]|nr:hypothetical protein BDB01DRAFT_792720 [Pilobolus umbonatus]